MDAEVKWFTNGNNLFQDGQRYAGAVVVSNTKVICAEPLLAGMLAQKLELATLIKVLELRKDKGPRGQCAFATTHICGAIYIESFFLTEEGRNYISEGNKTANCGGL